MGGFVTNAFIEPHFDIWSEILPFENLSLDEGFSPHLNFSFSLPTKQDHFLKFPMIKVSKSHLDCGNKLWV